MALLTDDIVESFRNDPHPDNPGNPGTRPAKVYAMQDLSIDPTRVSTLQQLKEDVCVDIDVKRFLQELRRKRVALVLSGGGGKGAYQAGSLLALFDCGITEFCALAGTSVGALNAALFHDLCKVRDRKLILQMWCGISPSKVLSFTPQFFLKLLAATVVFVAGLFAVLLRPFTGSPEKEEAREATSIRRMVFSRSSWFASIWSSVVIGAKRTRRDLTAFFAVVLLYLFGSLLRGHSLTEHEFVICTGILASIGLIALTSRNWLGSRLSLFSNAPLRDMIRSLDITAIRMSAIPIECTATAKVGYWFPFFANEKSHTIPFKHIMAPVYQRLNSLQSDEAVVEWLLQTAAIPEVFLSKRMHNLYLVDGGLVDNTPIFATLDYSPDAILVIYLDHKLACRDDLRKREELRLWRVAERIGRGCLTEHSVAEGIRKKWQYALQVAYSRQEDPYGWASRINDPFPDRDLHQPTVVPRQNPFGETFAQAEFIPIIPSQKLGGILCGTLNFGQRKARRLVALGYEDTLRQIQRLARESGTPHLQPVSSKSTNS